MRYLEKVFVCLDKAYGQVILNNCCYLLADGALFWKTELQLHAQKRKVRGLEKVSLNKATVFEVFLVLVLLNTSF